MLYKYYNKYNYICYIYTITTYINICLLYMYYNSYKHSNYNISSCYITCITIDIYTAVKTAIIIPLYRIHTNIFFILKHEQ